MRIIEFTINGLFILGLLVFLVLTIRYPRTVFVEIPVAILKFPYYAIRRTWPVELFLILLGLLTGKDINNEYKTNRKRFLTFARCTKFLLTTGTDEGMVKVKINEGIELLNKTVKIEEFKFLTTSEQIITIPPKDISFHDFNFLIQLLTDGRVETIGLVESKRLGYTVYNDPGTTNLIGQTDQGEKFFHFS